MKRVYGVLIIVLLTALVVGCTADTEASGEAGIQVESVDKYDNTTVTIITEKKDNCKYMIVKSTGGYGPSVSSTQMMNPAGLPDCE